MQYEKQQFISGAAGTNQNLVGSTFSAGYALHLKLFTLYARRSIHSRIQQHRSIIRQRDQYLCVSRIQESQLLAGNAGQLSERSAGVAAAHQAQLFPVHDGPDLRDQIEVLSAGEAIALASPAAARRRRRPSPTHRSAPTFCRVRRRGCGRSWCRRPRYRSAG